MIQIYFHYVSAHILCGSSPFQNARIFTLLYNFLRKNFVPLILPDTIGQENFGANIGIIFRYFLFFHEKIYKNAYFLI